MLYDQHAPWLLAVCLRYTGNREDAEDVLHDGFMKIIRSIKDFKQTGSREAWMKKIMVNTALNFIRDRKREKIFTNEDPDPETIREDDETEEICGSNLSKEQLMELVLSLPDGYRMVFNLYVMEDYTHKEIGEMLGISENTSKSQLSKARRFLRKRLFEYQNKTYYVKTATSGR
ncbi:MAG: RNA polymerase sigma factor [Bacteroidetes bacterium]|nr:RNA polymerase sigma factor [Bacteroidota bacterium]